MKITKTQLAVNGANSICKAVKWTAPSYSGNKPYGGECNIFAVFADDGHPIHSDTLVGDNIDYAFWNEYGELCYSDSDRLVDIVTI